MAETKTLGGKITFQDAVHAPFVYFEEAPAFGVMNGLVRVTLSAERTEVIEGILAPSQVITAYLRTNIQGARALIEALQGALLMAIPTEGAKN